MGKCSIKQAHKVTPMDNGGSKLTLVICRRDCEKVYVGVGKVMKIWVMARCRRCLRSIMLDSVW